LLFQQKDWSDLTYSQVKSMLEEQRKNYVMKDKDFKNVKTISK